MKVYLYIIFNLFITTSLKAQDSIKIKKNLFKINILSPGFTYEIGLSDNISISNDLNLSLVYNFSNNSGSNIFISPFLRSQLRYYYNLDKRILNKKTTFYNTGNFFSLHASY